MGCYSIHCIQCTFAYTWKGSSFVCYWELSPLCGGSTKRWTPSCWCMNCSYFFILFALIRYCWLCILENVYEVLSCILMLVFKCRYHFSRWYNAWMLTTWSNFLLLCCLRGGFYFDPISITLAFDLWQLIINAGRWKMCYIAPIILVLPVPL